LYNRSWRFCDAVRQLIDAASWQGTHKLRCDTPAGLNRGGTSTVLGGGGSPKAATHRRLSNCPMAV